MKKDQPNEQELDEALKEVESRQNQNTIGDSERENFFADAPSFFEEDDKGNKKFSWYKLTMYLLKKRPCKTASGIKRELFMYAGGIYISDEGAEILKKDIHFLIGSLASISTIKLILETIKDYTATDRSTFTETVNLLNFNNGVFDIRAQEMMPHDPKYLFFAKLPVDYKPEADCPRIKKFLSEILDESMIEVVQELFGYTLYRKYFIKKAFIFVGEGDTGKTTLILLLFALLGEKNISSISLQRLITDKFAAANLYNKLANLYDDLSAKDVNDNGPFKIATGGGIISGEKKFMDSFVFKSFAKLIFACNTIPDVKQANDDAYFLRWVVIHFSRIIDDDKKDRQLIEKLTTPEELSGLLNFALEGLQRLLKNQKFSYEKETHEIKNEMMRSASTVARFAGDEIEESPGEWISVDDMYHTYTEFSGREKIPAVSKKAFGGRLPMCAPYLAQFKPKDPKTGNQVTAWRNVRLKKKQTEGEPSLEELNQVLEGDNWFDSIS